MKNHDNFKLTFDGHEIKKNDKDKLSNLILESNEYVFPNKQTFKRGNKEGQIIKSELPYWYFPTNNQNVWLYYKQKRKIYGR